jgi:hypothetical protein
MSIVNRYFTFNLRQTERQNLLLCVHECISFKYFWFFTSAFAVAYQIFVCYFLMGRNVGLVLGFKWYLAPYFFLETIQFYPLVGFTLLTLATRALAFAWATLAFKNIFAFLIRHQTVCYKSNAHLAQLLHLNYIMGFITPFVLFPLAFLVANYEFKLAFNPVWIFGYSGVLLLFIFYSVLSYRIIDTLDKRPTLNFLLAINTVMICKDALIFLTLKAVITYFASSPF